MKRVIAILLFVASATAQATYEVDCDGYSYVNVEHISGTCADGQFEGYTDDGNLVSGECEFGGSFNAYDYEGDEEWFSGECEGE
jgi:hypothetical protein